MDEVDRAIEHRLAGGEHFHHKGCIHNLPPGEQVAMHGWTVEKWLAIIGSMPVQITPDDWQQQIGS
ncbi:hypothetical protein PJP13_24215 [Mycobacterium kansasii]